jgi:hypothetical protein
MIEQTAPSLVPTPAEAGAWPPGTADGGRLILAGQPLVVDRRSPPEAGGAIGIFRPKELLLALTEALAVSEGIAVERASPHFLPMTAWRDGMAVLQFGTVGLSCPAPATYNGLVLDGEDWLALAEEQRSEDGLGLNRRRVRLMDQVFSVAAPGLHGPVLVDWEVADVPVCMLLDRVGPTLMAAAQTAAARLGPVRWLVCDLETGHHNFLHLRRDPKLGTSGVGVLLGLGARERPPSVVAFATPATLADLGPALRAFAALQPTAGGDGTVEAVFHVFFFGTPEEFGAALASRAGALFFGDNFRCPAIRFLFAPFPAGELLLAIQASAGTVDTCFGGTLDRLAAGLRVPSRIVLGVDGRFDALGPGDAAVNGIDWGVSLTLASLARRRHKADRSTERALAAALERMVSG